MTKEQGAEMLRKIAEYYGITKNVKFAEFFGVSSQTSFQRMKNGHVDFEEIYKRCPDISPDWLLSGGEGPMLRSERVEEIASRNTNNGNGNQSVSVISDDKNMETALASLRKEQESLERAQEHISDLLDILKSRN